MTTPKIISALHEIVSLSHGPERQAKLAEFTATDGAVTLCHLINTESKGK